MKLKEEEREQQIERYLPLIHSLVRRYEGRGIPKEDLLQAGRIGLNRAIEKYDASGGCSFIPQLCSKMDQPLCRARDVAQDVGERSFSPGLSVTPTGYCDPRQADKRIGTRAHRRRVITN